MVAGKREKGLLVTWVSVKIIRDLPSRKGKGRKIRGEGRKRPRKTEKMVLTFKGGLQNLTQEGGENLGEGGENFSALEGEVHRFTSEYRKKEDLSRVKRKWSERGGGPDKCLKKERDRNLPGG